MVAQGQINVKPDYKISKKDLEISNDSKGQIGCSWYYQKLLVAVKLSGLERGRELFGFLKFKFKFSMFDLKHANHAWN